MSRAGASTRMAAASVAFSTDEAPRARRRPQLDVESAASTTSFAAKAVLLAPFVGVTALAAAAGAPPALAAAPFAALAAKFVKRAPGESRPAHAFKVGGLAVTWSVWAICVAWAPLSLLGVPLAPWHALAIYAPLFVIAAKRNRDAKYGPGATVVLRLLFDAPLVATALWLRLLGLRLLAPFATILDDQIVQGTMPLTAADAAILAAEPYNVCAVVNMCAEWPGPQKAYAKLGIVQCRLPFQDTSAPSAEALRRGAAFVRAQLEAQPGKRVFIHCKGGIARASAMSLAHYVLNRGHDVDDAIEEIKRKRPIVMRDAAKYASVLELTRDAARPPPQ